jgi:Sap, sulfolipid-1-addressing protein
VGRVFLFALTAALNPTLLTATTVMLLLPSPKRLMLGYWLGAMTTGLIVGVAIVEWLNHSSGVGTTQHSVSPGIDLALGIIALVAAYAIWSGSVERRRERKREKNAGKPKKTPKWQQKLSGGTARTTFAIGLLLSFPGASYLASLSAIHDQGFGTVGDVVTVVAVNLVMLILLEAPLLAFTVAPDWTPGTVERLKQWLARNGETALTVGLAVVGVLLVVRALLEFGL